MEVEQQDIDPGEQTERILSYSAELLVLLDGLNVGLLILERL